MQDHREYYALVTSSSVAFPGQVYAPLPDPLPNLCRSHWGIEFPLNYPPSSLIIS
jgi:hypothetical protein